MPRRIRCLLQSLPAAALLLLSLAAVASVSVHDDDGRVVTLEHPARRIVSLAPYTTELLYEVGAGDRVVAVTDYSDFPEAAKHLPHVGGLAGIDIEGIASMRPDLVIAWKSGTSEVQLAALERLHIPVFRGEPHTLEDVASSLERFGTLSGHDEQARVAATRFRTRVASLRGTYSHRSPIRVFYQVWNSPLMTVGGPQLTTQVIELCGGRNVFSSLSTLAPVVDAEGVIAADPQLIVTTSQKTGADADHDSDLALWQRWTGVSAVREKRYLFLDPATIGRHTSRILIGAETLCRAIDAARPKS